MTTPKRGDRFGFGFWLGWILGFAGSFLIAAGVWTVILSVIFGGLQQNELVLTWGIAVFGSWFLFLAPFMRKKEQIWKRLNPDQENAVDAWLVGTTLLLVISIATTLFWSLMMKAQLLEGTGTDWNGTWVKRVVGTWLAALIPLLAFMYRQADIIFKHAVVRQGKRQAKFRSVYVERELRVLREGLADVLKTKPFTLPNGHVVTAHLQDGRKVPHVFVMNTHEILGVYDREQFDFRAHDVVRIDVHETSELPAYEEARWLRLDGQV